METFADYNSINFNQLLSAIRLTSKEGTETSSFIMQTKGMFRKKHKAAPDRKKIRLKTATQFMERLPSLYETGAYIFIRTREAY